MPGGLSGSTVTLFVVRMSFGATSANVAVFFCASSSAIIRARPASCSLSSARRPFFGPSRTSAGLVPQNVGAATTALPSAMVKCSERWWPSTRQPQRPLVPGVPKTVKKYSSGSRICACPWRVGLGGAGGRFGIPEDRLEVVHDRRRHRVATLAEAGLQELERQLPLRLGHLLERESLAWKLVRRDEMPARAVRRIERIARLLALLGRRGCRETPGRSSPSRRRSAGRRSCRPSRRRRCTTTATARRTWLKDFILTSASLFAVRTAAGRPRFRRRTCHATRTGNSSRRRTSLTKAEGRSFCLARASPSALAKPPRGI